MRRFSYVDPFDNKVVDSFSTTAKVVRISNETFTNKKGTPFYGMDFEIVLPTGLKPASGIVYQAYQAKAGLKVGDSVQVRTAIADLHLNNRWRVSSGVTPLAKADIDAIMALAVEP